MQTQLAQTHTQWLIYSPHQYEGRVFADNASEKLHFHASLSHGRISNHVLDNCDDIKSVQEKLEQRGLHNWRIAKLIQEDGSSTVTVHFQNSPIGLIQYNRTTRQWHRSNGPYKTPTDQPGIVLACLEEPRPVNEPALDDREAFEFASAFWYHVTGMRTHTPFPHQITHIQYRWGRLENNGKTAYGNKSQTSP